ncbi:MAG TPA: glycosyltransferase family 4 protein [Vicinamibacteria bacterium]|nr:glycosyltransferase family 4 protein [Vicinamibacteria bacterium]
MRAIVYGSRPGDVDRAGRTARALRLLGASVTNLAHETWPAIFRRIHESRDPVWLVRSGAWPASFTEPPPSATGRPIVALGAVRPADGIEPGEAASAAGWLEAVRSARGEFRPETLPFLVSTWLDARMVEALTDEDDLRASIRFAAQTASARIVHYPGLDVADDDSLRIAEVVTSAQQGGAERIAIDLARRLRHHGLRSVLVTLGRPTRAAFEIPPGTVELAGLLGPDPDHRSRRAARRVVSLGFDLVHGHLLDHGTIQAFAARGLPIALTLHNTSTGWPSGTRRLKAGDAQLVIACAQSVEKELRETGLPIPMRAIWNGVDFEAMRPDASAVLRGRAFREDLGFGPTDFVLLSLANPRPQKRLHLLPGILRATRGAIAAAGWPREVRLVLAGSASARSPVAERAVRRLEQAIDEHGVREHVRQIGAVGDVLPCLSGSDVLVSTSAHEGLSLAHIEAIAAGKPIVVTDVGGARELGHGNAAVFLVAPDAPPAEFARVLAPLAAGPAPEGREGARLHFDNGRMAENYARLLPRALRASRRTGAGEGLYLVTNNFSTGGAQTSARRLLLALRARGVRARAAVIEEQIAFPTPGRVALRAAGVEVIATPPPGSIDAALAVSQLLDDIDRDRPRAVLLWNVIPEYKILLADGLIDIPVYDVSPGEMYFESLARYFAHPRPGLPYRSALDYGRRLAGVIVKHEGERDRARRELGAPVHVIPNGVPMAEGPAPARAPGARLVIGTSARLDPRKHLDRLLRALRLVHDRLPPYVLRIAGGVERGFEGHEAELRGLASGLSVEFAGELGDAREFLAGLDIFVLVAEPAGCPNASLEAMAEGLPVVATDAGGMSEQVEDGVTGRLVGREDEGALAGALLQLARDAPRRRSMGEAGRERAKSRFSMAAMVGRYTQVCLGAPGSDGSPAHRTGRLRQHIMGGPTTQKESPL